MSVQPAEETGGFLEFEGISKTFGGLRALSEVSGTIPEGKLTALIGPNGAGKTTLVNVITGFVAPDAGSISIRGRDITGAAPHRVAEAGVGRTFQDLRLFSGLTVLDNVMAAFPDQIGENVVKLFVSWSQVTRQERQFREKAMELLEFVGLAHKRKVTADNLSYGQQKRLALARVLASEAETLMLDEPAAGLDPEAVAEMGGLLQQLVEGGKTVCLIEHNLELVMEHAQYVIGMGQGRIIAEGDAKSVLEDEAVVGSYIVGGGG